MPDCDISYEEVPELWSALAAIVEPVGGVDLTAPTAEKWSAEDD